MTTLARWRAAQNNEGTRKEQERRPYLASECRDLRKAEKWRMQIIREIAKKVAQIQNAGLGEFRIRDLNDEINKLLREKRHWEAQIKELGGPDYSRVGPRMLDHEGRETNNDSWRKRGFTLQEVNLHGVKYLSYIGDDDCKTYKGIVESQPYEENITIIKKECVSHYGFAIRRHKHSIEDVPGNRGYKYFGAAKELPGVRELFEQEPPPPPRKTRAELMKDIDADYYGYMDDDDGILIPLEQKAEQEAREKCINEWVAHEKEPEVEIETTAQKLIPSQQDIQEALLVRKKKELLEKYGLD
ncbi:Pre-mRNA-splicing factor ISY1 like protein [Trachymyrmex cornetzi]|uniref:Pre-mRNA-splicing factor ISY1 like protein n=1 Tax=Trachymyrmex cornetzi TaxID=471704 RepID=A0A151ISA8_9HYME|nr:Pre-mRNA-splicing factor ISY1 like protein [Trachymyrmex cornetzi]